MAYRPKNKDVDVKCKNCTLKADLKLTSGYVDQLKGAFEDVKDECKKIVEKRDFIEDWGHKFKDGVQEGFDKLKDTGEEVVDKVEEGGKEVVDETEEASHDIHGCFEEFGDGVHEAIDNFPPPFEISIPEFAGNFDIEVNLHPTAVFVVDLGPDWLRVAQFGVRMTHSVAAERQLMLFRTPTSCIWGCLCSLSSRCGGP